MQQRRERDGQGGKSGIRGVVADIVQPPPELETAVEAVLGERLGNIIVESHDVGVEAIEFLKSRSEGRSSFIPLGCAAVCAAAPARAGGTVVYDVTGGDDRRGAPPRDAFIPAMLPDSMAWPTGDGVRGPMLELIGYDRKYDQIAAYLLGDVLVVEDLRRALELWRETRTDKTIVTLDGEVVDPHGVVTGGSRESAVGGVLEQKREIRELEEVVARLESDYQAALSRHVENKQQLGNVTRQIEELAAQMRTDEVGIVSQQKDLDRATDEVRRLTQRRAQLASQTEDLRRSLADTEARHENASANLDADRVIVERRRRSCQGAAHAGAGAGRRGGRAGG